MFLGPPAVSVAGIKDVAPAATVLLLWDRLPTEELSQPVLLDAVPRRRDAEGQFDVERAAKAAESIQP